MTHPQHALSSAVVMGDEETVYRIIGGYRQGAVTVLSLDPTPNKQQSISAQNWPAMPSTKPMP